MTGNKIETLNQRIVEIETRMETDGFFVNGATYMDKWPQRKQSLDQIDEIRREISLLQGEETALLLDWEYPWCAGAPIPHVVASAEKVYLIYRLRTFDPNWDGTSCRVITGKESDPAAVVEFIPCLGYRFVEYNDETHDEHPLFQRGLSYKNVHEIVNSHWIEEFQKKDICVSGMKHYFFTFHDETFECIAKWHSVQVVKATPFCDIVAQYERLLNTQCAKGK